MGGSLIRARPPGLSSRSTNRVVVAMLPKLRDVTISKALGESSHTAATSASRTAQRSPIASEITARRSRSARVARRSTIVMVTSSRRQAMTKAGSPPPEPRSTIDCGPAGTSPTNRSACRTASTSDRSPIAPRAWITARAARRRASSVIGRRDDHTPVRIVAFGASPNSFDFAEGIVDDLSIRR